MAHKSQIMLVIPRPVPGRNITRLPRHNPRVIADAIAEQISLAFFHIIPDRVGCLEASAILNCAVKRSPIAQDPILADILHGTRRRAVDVVASQCGLVDLQETEINRGLVFKRNVCLGFREGAEVARICVAQAVG